MLSLIARFMDGTNMGPIRGRQDPGEPLIDPMNFAIWAIYLRRQSNNCYETVPLEILLFLERRF